jgi:Arm DNA-binding domain
MGLGPLHTVSLAEARERARQARQILLDGDDPLEIKRKKCDEARTETAERILFKDAAQRFLDLHETTWKNAKHREQWKSASWLSHSQPQSGGHSDHPYRSVPSLD